MNEQAPTTLVSTVWQEVLQCEAPATDHHFFRDLGGNSLLGLQATVQLREKLGFKIPLRTLFRNPRFGDYVAALAVLAAEQESVEATRN
ncbi:phosphopantetheine-binding protein [Gandjariella thermophila]|uniref:Carrier domain-containing protein n=1 Tax=Gandjariella thermophila TaxID=1931992 RepID=A0A4D4J4Z3_9PSEU|nr:phosphopantetheine-binding protein [Gandjariella thermophila]GDY29606.1 hypothetical protein GTS_12390 [Gandjariella thermophila]